MSRERRLQPFPVLWLTAVWVLLWGNLSVANVLSGLVLGSLVLLVFRLPRLIVGVRVRPWPLLRLVARFLVDVVVASLQVAWRAVPPGRVRRSSVVVVQLRNRNELFVTVIAGMVSLVPGTVVVELDGDAGRLWLHVLGAETREQAFAARDDVLALEQRVLLALAADPVTGAAAGGESASTVGSTPTAGSS